MEQATIRPRLRPRGNYTLSPNSLLVGYPDLSDGAKITYLVIDSMDWVDGEGRRKGFAYPKLATLARLRGMSQRTIERHLDELVAASLIERRLRVGRPNLLVILDPAGSTTDEIVGGTPDKDVGGQYEEVKREEDKPVNEEQALSRVGEHGGSRSASRALEGMPRAKREYLATEMLSVLRDEHSLGFYRKVAEMVPAHRIFESLSIVRQLSRERRIRSNRGATFTSLLKQALSRQEVRNP